MSVTPGPGPATVAGFPRPAPSEVALFALTVVSVWGMARLFADLSFLPPVLATATAAHLSMWWSRRTGIPILAALALTTGVVLLVVSWTALPHETAYGLPTPGTWQAARDAIRVAGEEFGRVVAPAPVALGFAIASALGVAVVATLADWAAFRAGSTFEGAVPAFGLFVFTSLLGHPRHRWAAVGAEVVALVAYVVVHRAERRAEATPWFSVPTGSRRPALLEGAAVLGVGAVLAAVLLGPRLPGAQAEPLLRWRQEDVPGGGRRTTISPLVDIRGRLVDRSSVEVFTVQASQRAYWRLTALDTFDGVIWSSNDSYKRAGSRLPTSGPLASGDEIEQEFTVSNLASIWLPAAYRARTLAGVEGVSFNAESGSLISREATSDGLRYRVRSQVPRLTRAGLSTVPPLTGDDVEQHLELPDGISPRVVALAAQWTNGLTTPYLKARAIQDRLRAFTYDIGVDQGHDERALERFLFVTRRGYCEQFAGAYAVLARLAGLPARVAVGFTPGELGPDGRYHVQGLHAHAWPEVWFAGVGWVAFEPTPGRGAPRAEDYTGVPEAQASPAQPQVATTIVTTTTQVADSGGATTTVTTAPPPGEDAPPIRDDEDRTLLAVLAAAGAAAALVTGWLVGVPALRARRRRNRRAAARTPAERVLVAWTEADESLDLVGARRRPAETLEEHAARAAVAVPATARPMVERLARRAEIASYAPETPREVAAEAIADAATIERQVAEAVPRARRLRRMIDPRKP